MRLASFCSCVAMLASPAIAQPTTGAPERPPRVVVPAGEMIPFFSSRAALGQPAAVRAPVAVPAFVLDTVPVTNAEMLRFVTASPNWRRSQVARVFAESTYLMHWRGDLDLGDATPRAPVTHVSWFAAQAYCRANFASLPTTLQWEYALADGGRDDHQQRERALTWYARPSGDGPGPVAQLASNGYGVHDLVGLIWEWTLDFSADMLGSEPRTSGSKEESLFCGAGSLGARDPGDYATFMRYSFRTSLHANFTTGNLGFRCARPPLGPPAPVRSRDATKGSSP